MSIYHLVPANYYHAQPQDQSYQPETFAQEGFIHCTTGQDMVTVQSPRSLAPCGRAQGPRLRGGVNDYANRYFAALTDSLLVVEIDLQQLTAPLKFESPILPAEQSSTPQKAYTSEQDLLFPHIYGPLNREAIVKVFALQRNDIDLWQLAT